MEHPADTDSEEKLPAGDFAKCVFAILVVNIVLGTMLGPDQIGTSTGAGVLSITAVLIGNMAVAVALAYRDVLRACRCCRSGGTATKVAPTVAADSGASTDAGTNASGAPAAAPPAHVLVPAPAVHPAAGPDPEYLAASARAAAELGDAVRTGGDVAVGAELERLVKVKCGLVMAGWARARTLMLGRGRAPMHSQVPATTRALLVPAAARAGTLAAGKPRRSP